MGYWGTGTFANDDAMDWVWALEQEDELGTVADTLNSVVNISYIDAPDAAEALAAAEVVAALLGQPAADLPLEISRWLAEHRGLDARPFREAAVKSARAILGDPSELRDLWKENHAEYPFWKATVEALIARLGFAAQGSAAGS